MDSAVLRILDPILWSVAVLTLAGVAYWVIKKIQAKSAQQEPVGNELMAKFREMHSRGELSDAEFRTIKTTLAVRIEEELKDNGQ